jgi:hypothetical protein
MKQRSPRAGARREGRELANQLGHPLNVVGGQGD